MTRKSKREIERAVDDLSDTDAADHPAVVYEHPETGDWIDIQGRTVDPETRPIMAIVPSDEKIEALLEDGVPSQKTVGKSLRGDR